MTGKCYAVNFDCGRMWKVEKKLTRYPVAKAAVIWRVEVWAITFAQHEITETAEKS